MSLFTHLDKSAINFIVRSKRPRTEKVIFRNEKHARDSTIPGFKLYFRAILIKTSSYWHNKAITQTNVAKEKIQKQIHTTIVSSSSTKGPNTAGEKTAFATNAAGKTGYSL